ncbi:Pectinesterase inhibitor domain containing protein [Trema orientale]|uniref:Pectinesterase inhibitor domain containing protein n=1 Tax=Trema orientale TaxID=63057 RepID=A0A2P5EV98_TREOI|nr:Pectinesterase inhibitor domain containing protein [Trema orientale]
MARAYSIVCLLIFFLYVAAATSYENPAATSNFVKTSCGATTYPPLCIRTLSTYSSKIQNSPHQLALTALSVSLDSSKSAKDFVSKLRKFRGLKKMEYEAIADCFDQMGDSVDRLGDSVKELKSVAKFKGQDFLWHMSNVQTWVSAALTEDNTCLDGFAGKSLDGKIKASIRARVVNVAQLTSNALALCNRFASKN